MRPFSKLIGFAGGLAVVCTAACGSSDNSGDLTFPKQERTATLDFSDSSAVYLVSVYGTPATNEASSASDVQYTITPSGTATTNGASISRIAGGTSGVHIDSAYWDARIAFESDRRAQMDAYASSFIASGQSFTHDEALSASCDCSDTQTCAAGSSDCVDSLQLAFAGSTRTFYVVTTVTVGNIEVKMLSDNQADVSAPSALAALAEDFGEAAGIDLQVIGQPDHSGVLDVDGNGAITVAVTSNFGNLSSDIVGVFIFGDYLDPSAAGATGNHADILWAHPPDPTNFTEAYLTGTLAHEYQHLVSFALRSKLGDPTTMRETLWLDEGISHTMEDLTGWGGSTVDAFAEALQSWDSAAFAGPNDSVAQRGRAYTLIRHMIDQKARAAGATDAKSSQVLTAAHDLLSPIYGQKLKGFQHDIFQTARSSEEIGDWIHAVYTTGNSDAPMADASKQFLPTASSPRSNGQLIGFNPFASYHPAHGASDVPLDGPKTDDKNDAGVTDAIEDSIVDSGAHFYIVTGGSGTLTLTMTADDHTDISLDAVRVK